jgi:hypothetical protein
MAGMLIKFITGIKNGLLGILFPGKATRLQRNIRRVRNFILMLAISTLLWFVCRLTSLDVNIQAPWRWMRPFWLVLIFWTSMLAFLATRRLIEILRAEPTRDLFPEIQEAWRHARRSLLDVGVSPSDLPIYLVLSSRPVEGAYLFDSQQLRLRNVKLPGSVDAPIYLDLTDSAIYIVCHDVSLTGVFVRRIQQSFDRLNLNPRTRVSKSMQLVPPSLLGINSTTESSGSIDEIKYAADELLFRPMNDLELEPSPSTQEEIEAISLKLSYLCELISNDRKPYCPVNGILVALPEIIAGSDKLTAHAADLVQRDIDCITDVTGLDLPFAVICTNIERIPGFEMLIEKVDESQKLRYFGFALPTRLDLKPADWIKQIQRGLQWYRNSVMPSLFYKQFLGIDTGIVKAGESDRRAMIQANHISFKFLQRASDCFKRLESLCLKLGESHLNRFSSNPKFVGLFLTALEQKETGPWVFMYDMIKHLQNQQNAISWTPQAVAKDRSKRRFAMMIYLGIVCLIAMTVCIYFLLL